MNSSSSSSPSSQLPSGTSEITYWVDSDGTAHEKCKLLFFVGTEFLGEADYDPGAAPNLGYRRGGTAYFCAHCGEIWGRVVCSGIHQKPSEWWFQELAKVSCERHSDQWEVPGSFLGGYRNDGLLDYLPPAALRREFLIHMKDLLKEE